MIQVEDREENDHDVDHEEITMSESTSEGNDTSSNGTYRESRDEDMIQVEDREENDHDVDHEEITMSESTSEGNDTSSNGTYRESRDEDMIQVEDREENDHDVDHEEITMSESTSEGNDTSSNGTYRESRDEDTFQVEDSDSEDKHDSQFGKEHEEVTAASMSSLEENILRTNNVSRESGGGFHPIAEKTDTGVGEVKSAHSNCWPLPKLQKENDLSHLSPHDGIEMTEGREILETKNMENIHKAARDGFADEVLRLLENGGDISAFTSATNNTPLHYAAYEGHTEVVELLLIKRCDPNLSNAAGDTPLHLAALTGEIDVVKILSDWEGIDVNSPTATNETLLTYARYGGEKPILNVLRNPETISPEGNTPLHCASLAGHTEVVRLLLTKDADAKSETPTHHTPLHYAALRGDAILVKLLVYYGADSNAKDERNNTPLHYAALCGHTLVVELLVDDRADLSIRTDMGLSVLHKASFYGRLSTVQKLVELQNALISMRDKKKMSAEDTALIRGHVHTAWWLNKKSCQTSLQDQKHLMNICMSQYNLSGDFYHTYCRKKNASAKAVATAIDFGVCDMHYQDEQGLTLLHVAAEQNDRPKIRVLLERGALPTAHTHDGKTPSELAREKGYLEAAKDIESEIDKTKQYILRNPETISPEGNTPLHCASLAGHTEVVRLLLTKDADAKSETPTHHTPLHYAALRGDAILVKLLVYYGADSNAKDERNNTPLHYAALCGHTLVVELLVDDRADLSIRTDMGLSVLHKASFYGRLSTVQKLVELQNALISMRDKKKMSAEDTALIRGHVHTAWWLNKKSCQTSLQDQKQLMNICMSQYNLSGDFYHTYCRKKNASAKAVATAIDFGVCDMHYQDEQGRTLLHVAAEQNDRPKIRVLLERGALPTARTHDGKTPSELAREKGYLEAAKDIESEIDKTKQGCIEELAYNDLLNLITSAAQCTFDQDDKEQEARLAVVKKASSLLASGAPLEPPGGQSCYPLHLAITTNCTPLLSLLLAAGAPLTSSSNGLGPVETAWITPDATTWVGVVVTRAVVHKLRFEKRLLDPDSRLLPRIDTLMELLQGEKPWNAKVSVLGDSPTTLNRLLFRACASGATTLAWRIWHSGGSAVAQNKEGKTPLHGALDKGQIDTAAALALHMGANLFLPDNEGRLPIDLLSDDARSELLKVSVAQQYRLLDEELERAREPSKKEETKQFILLFLALYSSKYSQRATCSTQSWLELYDELSRSDVITRTDITVCEDEDSETIGNVIYSNLMKLVDEIQSKYPRSSLQLSNSENDMQIDTFSKILEKAIILSCEKEFPLFLYLLVHVGGQKVNQELEVCRASPLHYAARKNNASAARYLVSHGASVEAKDRFGNTPAHYACMYGHRDLGDFLRTNQVNRCGLTAMDLLDGYKNYLNLYELDLKSLSDIDVRETNTVPKKIETRLKELERKWHVYGIGKAINRVHVNYLQGEAKSIQTAVFNMVNSVKNAVAKKNPLFSGELMMLGSSADNVRLFCPDEFDCNIVLSNLNGYPNKGLHVSLGKMEPNYSGCTTKIIVSSTDADIRNFLNENCFLDTFYSTVKECVSDYEPEDERMAFIPPGVKRTQVGVGLSLAWTGKEYPLLLVDVDIVPTMEAPWPEALPRPPLTPPHLKSVYINSIGNGEWRFSFAQAENEIMRNLTDDQRQVFLACKMVLSSLKLEKWAPKDIQNRFQYFDKLFFTIPSPKGFILKNTFFLELQDFKDDTFYWKDRLQKRIRSIFKRMYKAGTKEPVKIEAYFAGSTEASCIGYGIAEIESFFIPKAGFHGVDKY
ncbi:uncharacterized protein LOC134785836 [Penaeus indicus]|uniref:uncharacterized protein LOC134785836 n=1 Tax=Penaeus indicus TaxID=29960 RepID=UPI00300D0CC0